MLTSVDLIMDTIDPVSAMKVVFCELTLAARRMHVVSPIVAAHTSGAIRFPVTMRATGREMTVRFVSALVRAIYTTAYTVLRSWRKTSESDKFSVVVRVKMVECLRLLGCFFVVVAFGERRKTVSAVWRKHEVSPVNCPWSNCKWCRRV